MKEIYILALGVGCWVCPQPLPIKNQTNLNINRLNFLYDFSSKSRITKMPWTPVAKKKLRLTNDENWRPQKLENMNAPTRIRLIKIPIKNMDSDTNNKL
jgi:hypothetical protein